MPKIKVGSIVECQFFNSVDKKFTGDSFEAKILEIKEPRNLGGNSKPFLVERNKIYAGYLVHDPIWIKRKEILRVIE